MKKIILVLSGLMVSCISVDDSHDEPIGYYEPFEVQVNQNVYIDMGETGGLGEPDGSECPKCECILKETEQ